MVSEGVDPLIKGPIVDVRGLSSRNEMILMISSRGEFNDPQGNSRSQQSPTPSTRQADDLQL